MLKVCQVSHGTFVLTLHSVRSRPYDCTNYSKYENFVTIQMKFQRICELVESLNRTMTLTAAKNLIEVITGYSHNAVAANEISAAVELILQEMPEMRYTGTLYRTVFVDAALLIAQPTMQTILSQIHAAETDDSFDTERRWYSWSNSSRTSDMFIDEYMYDNRVAYVLSCEGSGLDVAKLTGHNMLDEQEIIAPMSGNIHIVTLAYFDQESKEIRKFDQTQFKEFIVGVKKNYNSEYTKPKARNVTRPTQFDDEIYGN